jgi:hypothetical protein
VEEAEQEQEQEAEEEEQEEEVLGGAVVVKGKVLKNSINRHARRN